MEYGRLIVVLPNGARVDCRGRAPGPEAMVVLRNMRALRRLFFSGDVAFAESYVQSDWHSPDLSAVVEIAALNGESFMRAIEGFAPARFVNWLTHRLRTNSRKGSRRNIEFHYDLGNEFYREWLDADMFYSSGIYCSGEETLEEAQKNKIDCVLDWLDASAEDDVLEIGCGWGALAATVAERRKARVTGLTLSRQQLVHARGIAQVRAVDDRVDIRLQDYRDVSGRFDRILSIEMIEAVGPEYWPTYFAVLRERLEEGGHAVLQAITIADDRFERYSATPDFIQCYIFPGGALPSRARMLAEIERAGLRLDRCQMFGPSYASTLVDWRRRFHDAWPTIERLGFNASFRRLWDYYLCYCEGGFRSGVIDVGLYKLVHAK
jgi:cyclopropane-fatty-acyl-phospholipid synthase